jgi:hypothetical protein
MSVSDDRSLRDYDARRYGPFLGISDDGRAAEAIRDAAASSAKAAATNQLDPFVLGVGHDAERLRSVGEVPVGPDQFERIRAVSQGRVLVTTNVGSHVNLWHSLQPPGIGLQDDSATVETARWAREHARDYRLRDPQPWLRLRAHREFSEEKLREHVTAAAAEAPVCIAVDAAWGMRPALRAIDTAAAAGAAGVVVEGITLAPSAGRPALPGILNYYDVPSARQLLYAAHERGVLIEPALKIDTGSVANQVWAGLHAVRCMGFQLGKYGLFPLTFQEAHRVIGDVQRWTADWSAAPAFYIDVPWIDGHHVYEPPEALTATLRWLTLAAEQHAPIVLIDTVDKAAGRHLLKSRPGDVHGVLDWEDVEQIECHATTVGVKVLWAGGIELADVAEFGRRRVFGIYLTTGASQRRPVQGEETEDIGLIEAKQPTAEKIRLVRALLDAGFLGLDPKDDLGGAPAGNTRQLAQLDVALRARWANCL